jgi:hypothetical protein
MISWLISTIKEKDTSSKSITRLSSQDMATETATVPEASNEQIMKLIT